MRRSHAGDGVLVLDLEATCEDGAPAWLYEVIEIGAVLVRDGANEDFWQSFVRPAENPLLSPFCRELTGIRQEDVDEAEGFAAVMGRFSVWLAERNVIAWGSWGASDARLLADECARHGLRNPLEGVQHINIKKDFAKRRGIRQVGLRKAAELAGLPGSETHHRALSDAVAAAGLLPESWAGPA